LGDSYKYYKYYNTLLGFIKRSLLGISIGVRGLSKFTTIAVKPEQKEKLKSVPGRSSVEKIEYLLKLFNEYMEKRLVELLCRYNQEMYIEAWTKLLLKNGVNGELLETALSMLKFKGVDEHGKPLYIVNPEVCGVR